MKSRRTAAFLALFLGMFGVHRFYLGQTGLGIFYLFSNILTRISWMPMGLVLGIIDAIVFFFMSDEEFDRKYNKDEQLERRRDHRHARRDQVRQRRQPEKARVARQRDRKKTIKKRNPFKLSGQKKLEEYDLKGAISDLNRSVEIDADDPQVHYMLACAYSLSEKTDEAFHHLSLAVRHGFKDYEKIRQDDALAFVRINENFESFERAGYRLSTTAKSTDADVESNETLLAQLQRLAEMRKKGLITDEDFEVEKRRIMR